ncbi:IMP dehydrogenase [Shigella flexneri]
MQIIGGNVPPAAGAKALAAAGERRQGRSRPGSICTTRIVTSVGAPNHRHPPTPSMRWKAPVCQ